MKGLRETKTVSLEHYWELRLQERCTLESNTYTTTKVLPSIFSYLWKKVISLWFYHYFYHILLPGIKTWVSCTEQWLFFLVLSPLSASTFENLRTPRCKHFKIFQSVLCGFSPFNAGMTALSEANYILHNIAFVIFHVISLEQAMKVWCGNVLLEKKIRRNTPFWTSGTKIIKTLTEFFPVTGMEGDLNADTGTSNWKHQCLHA